MEEVTIRFSRVTVVLDLKWGLAYLLPRSPYSDSQPVRLTLDELEAALLERKKARAAP